MAVIHRSSDRTTWPMSCALIYPDAATLSYREGQSTAYVGGVFYRNAVVLRGPEAFGGL